MCEWAGHARLVQRITNSTIKQIEVDHLGAEYQKLALYASLLIMKQFSFYYIDLGVINYSNSEGKTKLILASKVGH